MTLLVRPCAGCGAHIVCEEGERCEWCRPIPGAVKSQRLVLKSADGRIKLIVKKRGRREDPA